MAEVFVLRREDGIRVVSSGEGDVTQIAYLRPNSPDIYRTRRPVEGGFVREDTYLPRAVDDESLTPETLVAKLHADASDCLGADFLHGVHTISPHQGLAGELQYALSRDLVNAGTLFVSATRNGRISVDVIRGAQVTTVPLWKLGIPTY
jgi:hypothetical protein